MPDELPSPGVQGVIAMRTVATLAALGGLLVLLQITWAPGGDVMPWPVHFWPLLTGLALLTLSATAGLVRGPGGVRLVVLLGLVSCSLYVFAVMFMSMTSSMLNRAAAMAGTIVAMAAVIVAWWTTRTQPGTRDREPGISSDRPV
jgi:peptidoglycan/LPS O-acetylase OafA/YrhL